MKRNRILLLLAVLVFVCLLPALRVAWAQDGVPGPMGEAIVTNSPENEPNDSIWDAGYLEYGMRQHGKINPVGDVDYYYFYGYPGATTAFMLDKPPSSPLNARLSLYDQDENLLTQSDCSGSNPCLEYVVAEGDDYPVYYLKVEDSAGNGGSTHDYSVTMSGVDLNEPNDFTEQATPISYGERKVGTINPAGDNDYFSFNGEAGDVVNIYGNLNGYLWVFDADGNELAESYGSLQVELPATGSYYLLITDYSGGPGELYDFIVQPVEHPIYVSMSKAGTVQGVSFQPGDILYYSLLSGEWELYFDASDVGLKGNLTAFAQYGYRLLLAYAGSQTLPNIGKITAQDVLQFYPYALGEETEGELDWFIDGSDVGLSSSAESIDGLASYGCCGGLAISTSGTARVPYGSGQLSVPDEDAAVFYVYTGGINTSGIWQPFLDTSLMGVGAADLSGISYGDGGEVYLSFDRAVTLGGIAFAVGDIVRCELNDDGNACASVAKFFDASDAGLGDNKVDAIEVGSSAYP